MATAPVFFATPFVQQSQISAANTNLDGSGTVVDAVSAQSAALKIERIAIKAIVSTLVAGMVRFFLHDGTNARLVREVEVPVITKSASVPAFAASVDCTRPEDIIVVPAGWTLKAATEKADTFNVHVFGALA